MRLGNLESGAQDCLFQMLSGEEDWLVMSRQPSVKNAQALQARKFFECIAQCLFAAGRFKAGHGEFGVHIFTQPAFIRRISLLFIHVLGDRDGYRELFFLGRFFRFVLANSLSCFLLIDLAICLEAPLSEDFLISPRFAARAAPAAICCFFDFAGILGYRL